MPGKSKKNQPERDVNTEKNEKKRSIEFLQDKQFMKSAKIFILVALGFYLLFTIFFSPVVFQGKVLSPAADMMAVAGMNKMGDEALSEGRFPLWNPTLFCGIPMFASLQYALFTYPPEYFIKVLSYIFGGSHYRIWFFHYLLAGLFAYLLARHFKIGKTASLLVGLAYSFSPQIIVLVDVGHGSKLMGIVYLPLLWLLMDRLRLKPSYGRAAALGAVYAVEILALHPQIAAYGGMMMGLYIIYYGIDAFINKGWKNWGKTTLLWLGSLGLSLALSAVLWVSVLDYARYSIRGSGSGGIAGGGVDWAYATGWSFHPLESLSYIFPAWFGFAGGTYWGTVGTPDGTPFTQNPMYFGVIVLILAILAVVMLPKKQWGFPLTLAIVAWVLSFGRHLPFLYGTLYHILPFFNKFRAPVMGQVLLLLAASLLAGFGLQKLIDRSGEDVKTPLTEKIFWAIGGLALIKALLLQVNPGLIRWFYMGYAHLIQPNANPQTLEAAMQLAIPDATRIYMFIAIFCAGVALLMHKKISWLLIATLAIGITVVDLWVVNAKLVSFQPGRIEAELFRAEGVVKKLQKEPGKFRVHALDKSYPGVFWQRERGIQSNTDPANWLSYFGIESTTGYFGAKPAPFQQLMNVSSLDARPPYSWLLLMTRPEILDALNVRYILTTIPLDLAFNELEKQGVSKPVRDAKEYRLMITPREVKPGAGAFVYLNPGELPRARLMGEYRVIGDFDSTLFEMMNGEWDPKRETLLNHEPAMQISSENDGSVGITRYQNEFIRMEASLDSPKLLVLADAYYPSGWIATIDGEPTEILRADGVLRAVAVPAGDHTIEFRFKPSWFYAGLTVSLLTILALLALLVSWLLRCKYNKKQ